MQGVGKLLGHNVEIGSPHVRADKANPGGYLGVHLGKESPEGLTGPVASDPQQAAALVVNLVNQGPKLSAFTHEDFVDPDGGDRSELSVGLTVFDNPLNRLKDIVPAGPEALRGLRPGELTRPLGQEKPEGVRQSPLARRSGEGFDRDPTSAAIDSAGAVTEKHRHTPHWDKAPHPFVQVIVARAQSVTLGAFSLGVLARSQEDLNDLGALNPLDILITEPPKW